MKLLISRTKLRRMKIAELIKARDELAAAYNVAPSPTVLETHDAVVDEAARRMAGKKPRIPALISRGAAKLMRIADVREKLEELMHIPGLHWTEEQRNTVDILGAEIERRRDIARKLYAKRKLQAEAFMKGEVK